MVLNTVEGGIDADIQHNVFVHPGCHDGQRGQTRPDHGGVSPGR
jgi:hypothetical protein